ncbi:hypothetical protein KIV45_11015 [Janthinobacterium lividum]|nr:hypothetical protein KIV45_11015 [Janthinobacterium lividum]
MQSPITIRLGRRARARIADNGLRALDVAIVPAAAGGPKGLILHQLDCWLFGDFLARAPRPRHFVGASIGAWRMAAAVFSDPVATQRRLVREYVGQRYPDKPETAHVSRTCRALLDAVLDEQDAQLLRHKDHSLPVLAVRGIGALAQPGKWRDRRGFPHYGQDHAARMRDWRRAIAESERMAAAFARWAEQPDLRQAGDL